MSPCRGISITIVKMIMIGEAITSDITVALFGLAGYPLLLCPSLSFSSLAASRFLLSSVT